MKAAAIDRFGPPSELRPHLLPVPPVGPDEVLIAVEAAGAGSWDAKIRDGTWAEDGARFPRTLGTDGAGRVVARGARVKRFRVGDRVYGYHFQNPKGGFQAEYVAIKAANVARVPPSLPPLEAGAVPITGLTALQGIDQQLRVRRGERVLIFGASGAVGTLAVQFAKQRGAHVIATASGRKAQAMMRELGADAVIDARRKQAASELQRLAPAGLDAVLVLAGGKNLEPFLDQVRPGGRIAYPNGIEPEPRRRRNRTVMGYDGVADRAHYARLDKAIRQTDLEVPLAAVYPLSRAASAHQRLEKGHVLGRIVFRVSR